MIEEVDDMNIKCETKDWTILGVIAYVGAIILNILGTVAFSSDEHMQTYKPRNQKPIRVVP